MDPEGGFCPARTLSTPSSVRLGRHEKKEGTAKDWRGTLPDIPARKNAARPRRAAPLRTLRGPRVERICHAAKPTRSNPRTVPLYRPFQKKKTGARAAQSLKFPDLNSR